MRAFIQQTLSIAVIITVSVYFVSVYTSLLGPYGTVNDVYHQIILTAVLFITYMLYQMFSHGGFRVAEPEA